MTQRARVLYVGEAEAAATLADASGVAVDPLGVDAAPATLREGSFDCVVVGEAAEADSVPTLVAELRGADADAQVVVFSADPVASAALDAGADDYVRAEGPECWTVLASRVESALDRAAVEQRGERRVRQVYERTTEAVIALDTDWRVNYANEAAASYFGVTPEEFAGMHFLDEFHDGPEVPFEASYHEAMETQEPVTFVAESNFHPGTWLEVRAYPSESGLSVYFRDVTERRRRERELEAYETIVDAAPDPIYTLDTEGRFGIVNDAAAEISDLEREDLVGEPIEVLAETGVADDETVQSALERVDSLDAGERARFEDTIHGGERTVENNLVKLDDGRAVNVVRDVTRREEDRRALARQRDELETLNRINGVIRAAIESLVAETSREGVERAVCRGLVDSELYRSAWIGELADGDGTVKVRTSVGEWAADSSPHTITDGPAIAAIESGEVQSIDDFGAFVEADTEPTPPGVAVPLSRGGTVDGVLAVCADRSDAFSSREREAFTVLGEVLGFALTATRHQELLFADGVTELEFDAHDTRSAFVRVSVEHDCRMSNRGFVPTSDGGLTYLTVTGADPAAVLDTFLGYENFSGGRVVSSEGETSLLELRHSGASIRLLLTEHGAKVREAVSDCGETRVVADVPPGLDVRAIVDRVQTSFPEAELVGKRRRERSPRAEPFSDAAAERLTDRQRTVLRAAFLAGYYDWPRESTAEEVADSMDIAAATLHQHLRAAEGKLLAALFEATT